ncbi:MAG: hypothetical protein HN341_16960 [Verrucomicrobia bacterium]|jgi:hypothetical protein|nr:hypothetical protein [Verrucomicrobiota bacterium]
MNIEHQVLEARQRGMRRRALARRSLICLLCSALAIPLISTRCAHAAGRTSNGNDFALYLVESRTAAEEKDLVEDALGRPHYFRYLQIMEIEETRKNGMDGFAITAFEPSSYLDVHFTVTRSASLRTLREAPESKRGDAIAVTGKIEAASKDDNTIHLKSTIVRHKDRLSPAMGQELLCEVDPRATFYSYTGGKQIVNLTYKDRDLIRHKDKIIKQRGRQGWADYLTAEVAKRNAARAAGRKP